MLAMATLDWIVLGVLAVSLAVGAWRGLVYELLYGVGWVVAFFAAQLSVVGMLWCVWRMALVITTPLRAFVDFLRQQPGKA